MAFFKDLPLDFTLHPVTNDIRPITDDVAIRRSIINILNTNPGSKPFRPNFGCRIKDLLFANQDGITKDQMLKRIKEAIDMNEPRVNLVQADVEYVDDGVKVNIRYLIKNVNSAQSVSTIITRTA